MRNPTAKRVLCNTTASRLLFGLLLLSACEGVVDAAQDPARDGGHVASGAQDVGASSVGGEGPPTHDAGFADAPDGSAAADAGKDPPGQFVVPDVLPDPSTDPPSRDAPVKVYILSGQSNMVGMGEVSPLGTPGTLETLTKTDGLFPHLLDDAGAWTVRNDVRYKGVITATADKWLTVGCAQSERTIGPELQFGHIMGYYHDEPVLLLKASQGNRSLAWDLLPPGSERYTVDGVTYAGYGDGDDHWSESDPYKDIEVWYAGKQYDDFVTAIHEVLDNFGTHFPELAPQGYDIAGFVWFQGHKDTGNAVHAQRYELNLVNFIKAFRGEFDAPDVPFVVATVGFDGRAMSGNTLKVAEAQLAVSGDAGKYPEFAGNVRTVDTRDFWRAASSSPNPNQGYHYFRNAETYMLVGDALGRGMVQLLERR